MADNQAALASMHQAFIAGLQTREQEILRYIAILVPAGAGFILLLQQAALDDFAFAVGSCAVLLLLLLGALYSLALGYNYRYLTLELAKLEALLEIDDYLLRGWPRSRAEFLQRCRACGGIPWCSPPEVIKVFWLAFLAGMTGATAVACLHRPGPVVLWTVLPCGAVSFALGAAGPWHFGRKFLRRIEAEPEHWNPRSSAVPFFPRPLLRAFPRPAECSAR